MPDPDAYLAPIFLGWQIMAYAQRGVQPFLRRVQLIAVGAIAKLGGHRKTPGGGRGDRVTGAVRMRAGNAPLLSGYGCRCEGSEAIFLLIHTTHHATQRPRPAALLLLTTHHPPRTAMARTAPYGNWTSVVQPKYISQQVRYHPQPVCCGLV